MKLEDIDELYETLKDVGITLGFGEDACINIPNPFDPDDTGWHLMLHDESLFEGREELFRRILEEWGLEWKPEEFLGWTHISIYRPGYEFKGWKNPGCKA